MPKLLVIPEDIYELLALEKVDLSSLLTAEGLKASLSANDIADIQLATESFPFHFLKDVGVEIAVPPSTLLQAEDYRGLWQRVSNLLETNRLQSQTRSSGLPVEPYQPVYSLNVVNGTLWVAVLQRQHHEEDNPEKTVISANNNFFDNLMANVLQLLPFHELCKSKLFTYYLQSINPKQYPGLVGR